MSSVNCSDKSIEPKEGFMGTANISTDINGGRAQCYEPLGTTNLYSLLRLNIHISCVQHFCSSQSAQENFSICVRGYVYRCPVHSSKHLEKMSVERAWIHVIRSPLGISCRVEINKPHLHRATQMNFNYIMLNRKANLRRNI